MNIWILKPLVTKRRKRHFKRQLGKDYLNGWYNFVCLCACVNVQHLWDEAFSWRCFCVSVHEVRVAVIWEVPVSVRAVTTSGYPAISLSMGEKFSQNTPETAEFALCSCMHSLRRERWTESCCMFKDLILGRVFFIFYYVYFSSFTTSPLGLMVAKECLTDFVQGTPLMGMMY